MKKANVVLVVVSLATILCSNIAIAESDKINLNMSSIETTLGLGGFEQFVVTLTAQETMENIDLWVVPPLQPYVTVSPDHFDILNASASYDFTVTISIPNGTAPGNYNGTIHFRDDNQNVPHVLPISIEVFYEDVSIPSTTKTLNEKTTDILTIDPADDSTLIFSGITNELEDLDQNDIIIIGVTDSTPFGFIGRVNEIIASNGEVIIHTEPASLEDAIEEGEINMSYTYTSGVADESLLSSDALLLDDTVLEYNINQVLYDADGDQSTTNDQIKAIGDISVSPSFDFSLKIEDGKVKRVSFVSTTTEEANLKIIAETELLSVQEEYEIARKYLSPITVWVGPVPVVIVPVLTLNVGIDGTVTVGIETAIEQSLTVQAGIEYDYGNWNTISDYDINFDYTPPMLTTSCFVRGYAGPELSLMIYGITGPYADLNGYLELDADINADPWWELYAGVAVYAGVQGEILGYDLFDYSVEVFDYRKLLASAPSGPDEEPDIVWVYINDDGAGMKDFYGNPISKGGFTGEMSKYETTNAQYCQFLNAALASGDIYVSNYTVYGSNGTNSGVDFVDEIYFCTPEIYAGSQITFNGSTFSVRTRDGYDMSNHPAVVVSWYGATAFCNYYGYRLPTQWEWQAVADYDGSYIYGCGTTIDYTKANYDQFNPLGLSWPYTSPIGYYPAFGYGMCDMAGNLWEWTSSTQIYNPDNRVIRGGCWLNYDFDCRVVDCDWAFFPAAYSYRFGFRVCRDSSPSDGMVFVSINDPGVPGHEPFNGEMSKYETTNAQYCEFLNAALASGDITVGIDNIVYGANGSNSGADFVGQVYYNLAGSGSAYNGATNGGAARINYTGSSFTIDSGFDNHPVTYVSWYGSTAFCNYYGYRLPTEWEWQAVADHTVADPYIYGCGPSINNNIANYYNSTHPDGTTVVGSFGTYGYGMCDMAGNVWEWTSSLWDPAYSYRVLRGGGWLSYDYYCAVSDWFSYYPDGSVSDLLGFRVCR